MLLKKSKKATFGLLTASLVVLALLSLSCVRSADATSLLFRLRRSVLRDDEEENESDMSSSNLHDNRNASIRATGYDQQNGRRTEDNLAKLDVNSDNSPSGRQLLITAKRVGDNWSPSSAFPLGECEGDCDRNSDCQTGLVCIQRSSGSPLPSGCTGYRTSSSIDFCAKPSSSGGSSTRVQLVGNNGSPSSAFPLQKCQGDCDNDDECVGSLVCFHRGAFQSVPGCSGGSSDSSGTDYCVEPSSSGGGGSGGGSSGSDFYLKLYWEQGYFWQEDPTETKWCLDCLGSDCDENDNMILVDCPTDTPTKLRFVNLSNGVFMIQIGGSQASENLCLELNTSTKEYEVEKCDSSNNLQLFTSGNGSHTGSGKFEIYTYSRSGFCLTNRHHPRYGEPLRSETCESARRSDTSFWVKV